MVPTFTIRETLKASTMVTIAARPSGTAATARDMAVRSMSPTSRFCSTATTNKKTHTPIARTLSSFPRSASRL